MKTNDDLYQDHLEAARFSEEQRLVRNEGTDQPCPECGDDVEETLDGHTRRWACVSTNCDWEASDDGTP